MPFLWPLRAEMLELSERGLWQARFTICLCRRARSYLRMYLFSFPSHHWVPEHIEKEDYLLTGQSRYTVIMIDHFIDGVTRSSFSFVSTILHYLLGQKYFTLA